MSEKIQFGHAIRFADRDLLLVIDHDTVTVLYHLGASGPTGDDHFGAVTVSLTAWWLVVYGKDASLTAHAGIASPTCKATFSVSSRSTEFEGDSLHLDVYESGVFARRSSGGRYYCRRRGWEEVWDGLMLADAVKKAAVEEGFVGP